MWDAIAAFFDWYWKSSAGLWLLVVAVVPVVGWEVVKRLPNGRSRRSRRRGKNVKSR